MVLPLAALMVAGGTGMQMFGQEDRNAAQDVALSKMMAAMRLNQVGGEQDRAATNSALGNLGGQWSDSNAQAVDDLSAANQRGGFASGAQQFNERAAGAAAGVQDPSAAAMSQSGSNMAFQNAQAQSGIHNARRTDALKKVLENQSGLTGMSDVQRSGMADKGSREQMLLQRINDIQRLQNYASGIRESALQRAGAEHGYDQARAASAGSGAMYLGALMGGVGSTMGQGQGQTNGLGAVGPYGDPANGVDYRPRPIDPYEMQA